MKKLLYGGIAAAIMLAVPSMVRAQELFVYTEPASNMPAHTIGIRGTNWLMLERPDNALNYHFIPELLWGINKQLMVHAEGYFSNRNSKIGLEGGAVYGKYRFYSQDGLFRHFRMAAFGRVSTNNADIHQEEIETNGHNSGFEVGLIGTQLLHKTALSGTVSFEKAMDNRGLGNEFPDALANRAINYSLSAGRLILPKAYKSYKQVNMNLMVEMLGQLLPENGKGYLDLAPSVQFIFNSQTRVDLGYRFELSSNMQRTAPNGFLIRVEHLMYVL